MIGVSPETLIHLVSRPKNMMYEQFSVQGLPSDAKCVGVNFDVYTRQFILAIESDTFGEVPEGEIIPYLNAVVHVVTAEDVVKEIPTYKLVEELKNREDAEGM